MNATVLIKTVPSRTESVEKSAEKLNGVRKSFVAYGRCDVVVFARVRDYAEVRKLTGEINSIEGVRSTETLVEA
ncbi:MAG: Lrp/AsnC ligand binding domain-containing protein [Nitrososphaerota archaeon]|nr:Lrp/AsnC ligand binding domain-containing protein [Nitrososphaerota archaeon]